MNEMYNLGYEVDKFFEIELSNVKDGDSYARFYLEIMRDYPLAAAQLARRKPNAEFFAKEILFKALRFQHSEAVVAIAQEFPHYLLFRGNSSQMDYYRKLLEKHQLIYQAELKAKMFSADINFDFRRKTTSGKLLIKLNKILQELDEIAKNVSSYNFEMYYYELQKKRAELEDDQLQTLSICKQVLKKMEGKQFNVAVTVLFAFSYPQLPILIQQKRYRIAKQIITKWSRLLKKGTSNWFVIHSYYVIMNFRKGDFKNVKKLLESVEEYPTDIVKERYELFRVYSSLFSEGIQDDDFVDTIYEHQKDKSGYNIAIVIAQLLHYLKKGDDESRTKFIDSEEAIHRYRVRHLKDDPRSDAFLKMLLWIPRCDFKRDLYLKKTKVWREKLTDFSKSSVEVEMVDYERLDDWVLEALE